MSEEERMLLPDTFIEVAQDMVDTKAFFSKVFKELMKPEKTVQIKGVVL